MAGALLFQTELPSSRAGAQSHSLWRCPFPVPAARIRVPVLSYAVSPEAQMHAIRTGWKQLWEWGQGGAPSVVGTGVCQVWVSLDKGRILTEQELGGQEAAQGEAKDLTSCILPPPLCPRQ